MQFQRKLVMKKIFIKFSIIVCLFLAFSCNQKAEKNSKINSKSEKIIRYAKGFSIEKYKGFSVLKVINPWPNANKNFTYILKQKNGIIPDSLKNYTIVNVPIKTIIVTSTTHIPSLEMLQVENSLIGFPNLDYISSDKIRNRIDAGKIRELGTNHDMNTEVIIDIAPSLIIGYGIDNNNPILENLQKSGLKVMINGDWNEETPLGKAEWLKFFGALYELDDKAKHIFDKIEKDYINTQKIAQKANSQPTILAGDMFEDKWYLPRGTSWGSQLLKEANGKYFWSETTGTGSLSFPFEVVLEKAKNAEVWITSGQFTTLKDMSDTNNHYQQFTAFQKKNVYSFSSKKGKKGGVLYYELAPNRPDIVLKDIVKILHPELLSSYKPFFFEKLK